MRATLLLALAAAVVTSTVSAQTRTAASWQVTIERRIGGPEVDGEAFIFSDVRGLVQHRDGRVFVADSKDHNVRVFSSEGDLLATLGRQGQGPSDFIQPCCLSFGKDGLLWVKDFGNKRYSGFDVSGTVPRYVRTVRGGANPVGYFDRVAWTADGRLVDIQSSFEPATGEFRLVRLVLDSLGRSPVADTIESPPTHELRQFTIRRGAGASTFAQPFGPRALHAFGPDGEIAVANGGRYSVRWLDANGRLLRVIVGQATPPALSSNERASATRTLDAVAQRNGISRSEIPFGVPELKPVLASLGFDLDGRLWVRRSNADGSSGSADVYDRQGKLAARVTWPSNLRLGLYAISGRSGVGIQVHDDETLSIVQVRLR